MREHDAQRRSSLGEGTVLAFCGDRTSLAHLLCEHRALTQGRAERLLATPGRGGSGALPLGGGAQRGRGAPDQAAAFVGRGQWRGREPGRGGCL